MKNKIVLLAKTDINTDGRILNQLNILKKEIDISTIEFILLPDKKVTIQLGDKVNIHTIRCIFRHNKWLRVFTALEFSVKALVLLLKLKPDIIHAHDSATTFTVLLYRLCIVRKTTIIYDDHEIPNGNGVLVHRVNTSFENFLLKKADVVIFANQEREKVLKKRLKLQNRLTYFLNLPYINCEKKIELNSDVKYKLQFLDKEIERGIFFIIHQGPLKIERGRAELAQFVRRIPKEFKILLIGGSEQDFHHFLKEFDLREEKFIFIGSVNYYILPLFWDRGVASIVMYLPRLLNNKLCAPNRFYLSLQKGLPTIVNRENPTLFSLVEKYGCGYFVEDFEDFDRLKIKQDSLYGQFEKIKKEQVDNFIEVYNNII